MAYVHGVQIKLPLVLFCLFVHFKFDELRLRSVTYDDGFVRVPQPGWSDYMHENKLEKINVPLPGGGAMPMFTAYWRGGPDFPANPQPTTNTLESYNGVTQDNIKAAAEELRQRGEKVKSEENLLGPRPYPSYRSWRA